MKGRLALIVLAVAAMAGCAGIPGTGSSSCFQPQPGIAYLDRNAVYVANAGSSTISAFQALGTSQPLGPVCGSPFHVSAPPTALLGALTVLSGPSKTISWFKADVLTSQLSGPLASVTSDYTPVAATPCGSGYFCVANSEGNVSVYTGSLDSQSITPVPGSTVAAGSQPSAIAAYGNWLYVANSGSNNISAYTVDAATGVPTPLPGSPFPAGTHPSAIRVMQLGIPGSLVVAMVANAGSGNVSVYSVAGDGSLTPVPGSPFATGNWPTAIATDTILVPGGHIYVANQGSNSISVFSIDSSTGALTPVAGSPFASGGVSPSSMAIGGGMVYIANTGSSNLSVLSINWTTGALTPVAGSPFAVGNSPQSVVFYNAPI